MTASGPQIEEIVDEPQQHQLESYQPHESVEQLIRRQKQEEFEMKKKHARNRLLENATQPAVATQQPVVTQPAVATQQPIVTQQDVVTITKNQMMIAIFIVVVAVIVVLFFK